MTPRRIQRKRIRGWKMPHGTVSCTRPGPWGNPYILGKTYGGFFCVNAKEACVAFENDIDWNDRNKDRLMNGGLTTAKIREELRGKDLACFCREDAPYCHVDTLLRVANS